MRNFKSFTIGSAVWFFTGCLAILLVMAPTAEAFTICSELFLTQRIRPTFDELPPPPKKPNETYVYQVSLPTSIDPQATVEAIEKFLESKQMSHLNARLLANSDGFTMWSDPVVVALIRRQFSDSKWTWTGDFEKVVDPIHPKIQAEIDRLISLYSDLARDLYQTLFVRNFHPYGQIRFLTSTQLAHRKTIEELKELYANRKAKMLSGYLLKKESNPERLWNGIHHNRTERIQLNKASIQFHAVEMYLNVASALTDAGLEKLSGGSEKYYKALRALSGVSNRINSDNLKNEIVEAAAKAKMMSESEVSQKARAEAISTALSGVYEGIRRSSGDPLLLEIGYGLLNLLLEKIPGLDLGKFTYLAYKNAQWSVFNQEEDGVIGPLQMGRERVLFLQSMLMSEFVSERPRLAAQSLLRRVVETQESGQEIRLLPKEKIEEIYLKFAAEVTTEASRRGLFKFGFFINETFGMQSEVSQYVVMADREALVNGIELTDWRRPKQATARLENLLPGAAVNTPKQPLLLEFKPANGPRVLVFERGDLQVFYSKLTGNIEILNSNKAPIVLRHYRDREDSNAPEIQIINGMIVITDSKTESAKQYRLSDGYLLRAFKPEKFRNRRIREEHRGRE